MRRIYTSDDLDDYLEHHGILGQKKGNRRFQNEDGSLTPEGRIRYGVGPARESNGTNAASSVSNTSNENSSQKSQKSAVSVEFKNPNLLQPNLTKKPPKSIEQKFREQSSLEIKTK